MTDKPTQIWSCGGGVQSAAIVEENGMNLRNLKLLKNCSKCGKTFTTLLRFKKVGFHVCYRCKTK